MNETKYNEWKRKVAHKRKKEEDRKLMVTYDALKKDYNNPFDFEVIRTPVNAVSRKLKATYTIDTSESLIKAFGVPAHLLGNNEKTKQ